jgi:hypothetical protein
MVIWPQYELQLVMEIVLIPPPSRSPHTTPYNRTACMPTKVSPKTALHEENQ